MLQMAKLSFVLCYCFFVHTFREAKNNNKMTTALSRAFDLYWSYKTISIIDLFYGYYFRECVHVICFRVHAPYRRSILRCQQKLVICTGVKKHGNVKNKNHTNYWRDLIN